MPLETKDFDETLKEIDGKLVELGEKAAKAVEVLEAADSPEETEKLKVEVKSLQDEIEVLNGEKQKTEALADRKAMGEELETLRGSLEAIRKPGRQFNPASPSAESVEGKAYGSGGSHSAFNDIRLAANAKGGITMAAQSAARERLEAGVENFVEGKAMQEGIDTAGGYLVPPEISDELIRLREPIAVLRQLFSSTQVSSDELRIASITAGTAVGWTAELAEKTQSELKYAEISANTFTAAGLVVASNQLLADSKFSVDQIITGDLAKRFTALEEQAFINGSGVGQPLGIRKTAGVEAIPFKSSETVASAAWVVALFTAVNEAITEIYSTYYGAPDAIVMHPKTWGAITRSHESSSPSTFLISSPGASYSGGAFGRRGQDPIPGFGSGPLPRGELFGLPVFTSPNIPLTLGTESNESCILVGAFHEGLVLDRQGIVTDQSPHVFFTSNQTVFRSEERLGFTAARYPNAFKSVEGSGLKNT